MHLYLYWSPNQILNPTITVIMWQSNKQSLAFIHEVIHLSLCLLKVSSPTVSLRCSQHEFLSREHSWCHRETDTTTRSPQGFRQTRWRVIVVGLHHIFQENKQKAEAPSSALIQTPPRSCADILSTYLLLQRTHTSLCVIDSLCYLKSDEPQ